MSKGTSKTASTVDDEDIKKLLRLGWCQEAIAGTEAGSSGWYVVVMPWADGQSQELLFRYGRSTFKDAMGWRDGSGAARKTWMLGPDELGHISIYCQSGDEVVCITPEHEEIWAAGVEEYHRIHARVRHLDDIQTGARARAQAMCAGQLPADITLPHDVWGNWLHALQSMEQTARKRGWRLEPLGLLPPATAQELAAVEARHGMPIPGQLRAVLEGFSAELRFGWRCARNDEPKGKLRALYSGGIRDTVWSLSMIEHRAITNFQGWRDYFFGPGGRGEDDYEQPNPAHMWEEQFAIAELCNGDMLTIDTRNRDPLQQPVRYFSHEVEGLHGQVLAPNLFAFLDQWIALGCAGDEQHGWLALVTGNGLRADSKVGKLWAEWLAKDPFARKPDEAPRAVLARTAADLQLLACAKADDIEGVRTALEQGAHIDCSPDDWQDENHTAVIFAVLNKSIDILELLHAHGASLSTTLLPMYVAAGRSNVETARWLIEHGARLNPWRDDLNCPLHALIGSDYSSDDYRVLLDLMLSAGADPDVVPDKESLGASATAFMRVGPWGMARLLAAGANAHARDVLGRTAMHVVPSAECIELLVSKGLDVNALSYATPHYVARTPLQCLLQERVDPIDIVKALLAAGADPRLPDSKGENAWWYCTHASCVELLAGMGFDPDACDAKGQTLLHRLLACTSGRLYDHYQGCAETLLRLGLPIDAADHQGNTPLHVAASHYGSEYDQPTLRFLLEQGASRAATNQAGKTAWDMVPKKHRKALSWLRA